jgi:Flp pilus assembly protein TadG
VTGRAPWRRIVTRVIKRQSDERGQVTAFVVVITMALILCAGLVIDGGLTLAAKVRATDEAQAAARAGAEAIDLTTYRNTGTVVLDPTQATNAAEHYLASTGNRGQVDVAGDVVTVTVEETQPTQILGVVGLHATTVSASANATAVRGITGPGQ